MGGITIGNFPDGEISCKVDEDIRGRDVFLVQPTCPPVNENLMELLIMIESCKRASAERITAVVPYLRLRPAGSQGRRPGADHRQARGQHHHPRRRRPGAGDGPARRPDSGLLRRAGRPPLRGAGAERIFSRAGLRSQGRGRRQPRRGEHQAGPGPCRAAGRQPGDRRQAPRRRRAHQAGKRHRRLGRRARSR